MNPYVCASNIDIFNSLQPTRTRKNKGEHPTLHMLSQETCIQDEHREISPVRRATPCGTFALDQRQYRIVGPVLLQLHKTILECTCDVRRDVGVVN